MDQVHKTSISPERIRKEISLNCLHSSNKANYFRSPRLSLYVVLLKVHCPFNTLYMVSKIPEVRAND